MALPGSSIADHQTLGTNNDDQEWTFFPVEYPAVTQARKDLRAPKMWAYYEGS